MSRLPHTISNQSLTFFVKGKPYSLTKDHEHYAQAKALLQQPGSHPVQQLVEMVDQRAALLRDSHGALQFIGTELVFKGHPITGLWADKIKQFRAAGEPFAPLFNALGSLVLNPTPEAIERLPVFLEKSNLGFLEDGRFIAYKAVREDYFDIHTGNTFRNMIGDTPFMPRVEVDANPNSCCSTGLHVGTPSYVQDFSLGTTGRRVMLIAVWPHDVVSVPISYGGTKMRICAYEVIDELDEVYAGTILGRPVITPRTQLPAVTDEVDPYPGVDDTENEPEDLAEVEPYDQVKVGDVIDYTEHDTQLTGRVIEIDADDTLRVCIEGITGGKSWVSDTNFERIVPPEDVTAAMLVVAGAMVSIAGHAKIRDGDYEVAGLNEDDDGYQDAADDEAFAVKLIEGEDSPVVPIANRLIQVVIYQGEQLWPRTKVEAEAEPVAQPEPEVEPALEAQVGDLVETVEGGWPPAGIYPVVRVDEGMNYRLILQTEHDGEQGVLNKYVKRIVRD